MDQNTKTSLKRCFHEIIDDFLDSTRENKLVCTDQAIALKNLFDAHFHAVYGADFGIIPDEILKTIFEYCLFEGKISALIPQICKRWKTIYDSMEKRRFEMFSQDPTQKRQFSWFFIYCGLSEHIFNKILLYCGCHIYELLPVPCNYDSVEFIQDTDGKWTKQKYFTYRKLMKKKDKYFYDRVATLVFKSYGIYIRDCSLESFLHTGWD